MKKREPVSKIMTPQPHTINVNDNLEKAELNFKKYHIRHLPVMSGEKLVGILSLTDLARISFVDFAGEGENNVDTAIYNMLTIEQVMVGNVVSVQASTTIKDVAETLSEKEFHALPVLDGEKLVGIITTTDLIRYLLDQY